MRFDHVTKFDPHRDAMVLSNLLCDDGDSERDSWMSQMAVSKQVKSETGYTPEVVRIEAPGLEGCAELVVWQSLASLVCGKSSRVYSVM